MLKGYKYRIYPNEAQRKLFELHFGHSRHVYNWARDLKIKYYEETGKSLSRNELQKRLVLMKKIEKPWLNEVNSQSLLAALFNLENAYRNFFQKRAAFPEVKKKYDRQQSFQCPQHVTVDFDKNELHLPKIKSVYIKLHRHFSGQIKTVTIRRVSTGKYFASILVDDKNPLPMKSIIEADKTLGMDVGLAHYVTTSEGVKKDHPTFLRKDLPKLAKIQKQFSRKNKGSKNRAKQRIKLAKCHERVANCRFEFVHKLAAEFAFKNHETSFAVEGLHIKGMIKNRKLSRAIADSGWRKFISALTYKCDWVGKNVLVTNRFAASSKTCHSCKFKLKKLSLAVRMWKCDGCGKWHDRDINAAINTKVFALADAVGCTVCVKQFPYSNDSQRSGYSERSNVVPVRWVARSSHHNA